MSRRNYTKREAYLIANFEALTYSCVLPLICAECDEEIPSGCATCFFMGVTKCPECCGLSPKQHPVN